MATSMDTSVSPQLLHQTQHHLHHHNNNTTASTPQPPPRSKRTVPSAALALASLRTSFSRASIQSLNSNESQQTKKRESTSSNNALRFSSSSTTTPLSTPSIVTAHQGRKKLDSGIDLHSISPSKLRSPGLPDPHDEEGSGGGYFDDILDKYCHSDEDPTSPSTASPTSPFSTGHGWVDFRSPQPPTPPVTSNRHQHYQQQQQQSSAAVVPPRRSTPLRISSTPAATDDPSTLSCLHGNVSHSASAYNSPMLVASAKVSASIQHPSNTIAAPNSSGGSLQNPPQTQTGNITLLANQPLPSMRNYVKRPVPVPGAIPNCSNSDLTRPEVPVKDQSRGLNAHAHSNSSQGPLQPQQQSLNSFQAIVDESMRRNKGHSVTSFISSASPPVADVSPYAGHAMTTPPTSSSSSSSSSLSSNGLLPERSNSHQSYMSNHGGNMAYKPRGDRYYMNEMQQQQQHQHQHQQHQYQQQRQQFHQQGMESPLHPMHQRSSQQYLHSSPSSSAPPSPFASPALTPSEMLSRRFDDRARTLSQSSLMSPVNSHVTRYSASLPHGIKSALVKTTKPFPIVRRSTQGSPISSSPTRKVIFGDMITIVTVERAETPPPIPASDKKKKKERLKLAKKMMKASGNSKAGPHPDPEYDSDYYNAPYTPEPAEVVVTQAPWIGNPNYDEEKQNSSFYYDDAEGGDGYEYEYGDDYEYEAPPPEDDDEEDDDDDEEDEDDDYVVARSGGSGGAAAVLPKKKGGIFKFKRAVNRLLRN
ncbi:hypothetical protein EDD11_008786 [Mortierella claussenii]|nr:hypothetical protein EDD11_008786 [Mortierella claussenii]